jgi:hypothetical protein
MVAWGIETGGEGSQPPGGEEDGRKKRTASARAVELEGERGVFLPFHFTNGIAFVDTILHRVLMEFAYSIPKKTKRLTCFPNTNYTMYAHSHQAYTPSVPF